MQKHNGLDYAPVADDRVVERARQLTQSLEAKHLQLSSQCDYASVSVRVDRKGEVQVVGWPGHSVDCRNPELLNAIAALIAREVQKQRERPLLLAPEPDGHQPLPSQHHLVDPSSRSVGSRKKGPTEQMRTDVSIYMKTKRGLTKPGYDVAENEPAWYPRFDDGRSMWRPIYNASKATTVHCRADLVVQVFLTELIAKLIEAERIAAAIDRYLNVALGQNPNYDSADAMPAWYPSVGGQCVWCDPRGLRLVIIICCVC